MSKKLYTFWIALTCLLVPSVAFAQASILDDIDNSILELSVLDDSLLDNHFLGRSIGPSSSSGPYTTGGNVVYTAGTSYNTGGTNYNSSGSYNSGTSYSSGRTYQGRTTTRIQSRRVYHHNNYNYYPPQPRLLYQAAPVTVYRQPAVIQSTETYSLQAGYDTTVSMGLRAVGFYPGKLTSLNGESLRFKTSGGIGFYSRFRPVRWISLEFITDITYGKDEDCTSYFRMPLSLGLQLHFFDYGMLNVYAVAAASLTVTYTNSENLKDQFYQYGGQLGAGASVVLGLLELGIDIRYTLDTPPEAYNTVFGTFYAKDELQHGVVFAANIGLAF